MWMCDLFRVAQPKLIRVCVCVRLLGVQKYIPVHVFRGWSLFASPRLASSSAISPAPKTPVWVFCGANFSVSSSPSSRRPLASRFSCALRVCMYVHQARPGNARCKNENGRVGVWRTNTQRTYRRLFPIFGRARICIHTHTSIRNTFTHTHTHTFAV